MTKLADLITQGLAQDKLELEIAQEEGFNVPGSVPNRNNNPGDLRHSPHSTHSPRDPDAIGAIDTPADGWADLERQLQLYAARGLTLEQAIYEFAPPNENNSAQYLQFVCAGLGCTPDTPVAAALLIQ
jgi:hypothetical protein